MFGLSALGIQKAKPFGKPYKLTEKGGLQLVVMPNGSKYFQLRYAKLGKDTTMQLGVYPIMTLEAAREAVRKAKGLISERIDPVQNRQLEKQRAVSASALTFEAVAIDWLTIKERTLVPSGRLHENPYFH